MPWRERLCGKGNRGDLVLLLSFYLLLGLAFNLAIPPFEAPDEPDHFAYVTHLRAQRRLPIQGIDEPPTESHQPPLYYALAALVGGPFLPVNAEPLLNPNPHWGYDLSRPGEPNNLNRFSHGPEARWPYAPAAFTVHWLRLLSLLCGLSAVILAYIAVRAVFPRQPSVALGTVAFMAFNPQYLFISSVINNDALAICFSAAVFWRLTLALRDGLTWRGGVLIGGLLSLALLTKLTTVMLLPLAAVVILFLGWQQRSWRTIWQPGLTCGFMLLVMAGWWFVRNRWLYGDFLAYGRWRAVWDARHVPASPVQLAQLSPQVWRSAWVHFGWGNVVADPALYQALAVFCVICLSGWFCAGIRRRLPVDPSQWSQISMLAFAVLLAVITLLSFQRVATFGSNARYLFVALPAFALFLFVGLSLWFPESWTCWLGWGSVVAGVTLSAFVLCSYLIPVYAPPPRLQGASLPSDARRLDWRFGDHLYLLGYRLAQERVQPGDMIEVTLYWQPMATVNRDYSVFLHLLGSEMQPWGSVDSFPGMGTYPTRAWHPLEVIVDCYRFQVAPEAETPSLAWLEVGLYAYANGERLPLSDASGQPLSEPRFARLAVSHQHAPPTVQVHVAADFGGQITLLGYDWSDGIPKAGKARVSPGQTLRFILYWQALEQPAQDYTRFAHLVNWRGELLTQHDAQPGGGRYPSGLWTPGDWVADSVVMPLPADVLSGEYTLIVGLYDLGSLQRLPPADGSDHLRLMTVEIR
ncbi:MAG: hypothetical protein H8E35_01645 [Ardenticatenia bacterium]|nr:hypothetical protein [Ardenticatenia bacterium]